MSDTSESAKYPAAVSLAIIGNLCLLAFTGYLWFGAPYISEKQLFGLAFLSLVAIANLVALTQHANKSPESLAKTIGLYFKRARLEQEARIRELESKAKI